VTHIENMSYCKPRIEYYEEICVKMDERPEACLMVGNDPINNMIVATIGMKTFLIIDSFHFDESSLAERYGLTRKQRSPYRISRSPFRKSLMQWMPC
jgi:FMN phosphatase YigB (HAD superfamily)